ncbi:putative Cell cycle and apoptosis regulator protein [Helianthus annuus]|nr:putative Cell cycle and apoptosis regulator protein [Helianthus annuus]
MVYSSNLVATERDYLSLDKRYSRLYVSPQCSKVIVNWSKGDLSIPFNTPISFEHDFVHEETPSEHESASKTIINGDVKLESGTTRWNAKMLLMCGLSRNSWEELSSERKYEDRIPHLCNMLRFAFLKDGNSSMAIGGSWNTVDGSDPSVNKSTLVQTVLRHAKEFTGLDLKNCRNWNPFLEIHYDRVGKDGLFSHKEITVLYIPDLSDCLPSIDAWRDQWLAHKKAISERERLQALKNMKPREKKEASKDKEPKTKTNLKSVDKGKKKKVAGSASKVNVTEKAGKEGNKTVTEKKDVDKTITKKKDDGSGVQTPGSGKKKKIIRKVIKKKVVLKKKDAAKKATTQDDANTEVDKTVTEKKDVDKTTTVKKDGKLIKKKVVKKSPVVKADKKEDEVKEPGCSDDKTKNEDVVVNVKATAKKKIVKKVTKKSVAAKVAGNKDKVVTGNEAGSAASEVKMENNEKVQVKEEKKAKVEGASDKNEKSKGGKEKKDKDIKTETRGKDVKDKKKVEEPPRHPGLFLRTKGSKNSKLRSLSLSLDSLLDYTDKDTEESTFELSLFAETFYEMLQFQMGSRILTFLQKLRIKFVAKTNEKKRQREEVSDKKEKEKAKKSSSKRQKTDDVTVESKTVETETLQEDEKDMDIDNLENTKKEESEKDEDSEEEPEEDSEEEPEEDPEEDPEEESEEEPEEDPEEDEHMADASPKVTVNPEKKENLKVDTKKKESLLTIDKELLQAFRFFDRNRVGYIRVEDLRLILHSLGKCMSHRDVKELVHSALLESNTGRDDLILYKKLVEMTDI